MMALVTSFGASHIANCYRQATEHARESPISASRACKGAFVNRFGLSRYFFWEVAFDFFFALCTLLVSVTSVPLYLQVANEPRIGLGVSGATVPNGGVGEGNVLPVHTQQLPGATTR